MSPPSEPPEPGSPSPLRRRGLPGPVIALAAILLGALAVGAMYFLASRTPGVPPAARQSPGATPGPASGGPTVTEAAEQALAQRAPPVDGHFDLTEPMGAVSPKTGFTFRWASREPVPIRSWQVRVIRQSNMLVIWSSEQVQGTELTAPPKLLAMLEPGERYVWRVMATPEEGGRMRSHLVEFRVPDLTPR